MVKFFKRAWIVCLSLCLALGICVAATACGDTTPTQVNYKVTVTCEEEPNLLLLVSVQLLDKNGKAVTDSVNLKDGSASFTLAEGEYTVKLVNSLIEAGDYTYPETKVTKENHNATVAISRKSNTPVEDEKVEHRVKVIDPEGNPVEGAQVQVCIGTEHCDNPVLTGADGVAVLKIDAGVHQIHILDNDLDDDGNDILVFNGTQYKFDNEKYETNENGGEYTVQLDPVE